MKREKYSECVRIGFFGDGPWAHQAFDKLIADKTVKIEFICVRNTHRDPALIERGNQYGIDIIWTSNVNSNIFLERMRLYHVDLNVSMSFNQIFKNQLIQLPPLKTINCHAGKLPFYRGCNVLNWVLINDEKEFGVTVHYIDEEIDTGDIILQKCYSITDDDTYETLLQRAYTGCADVLYDAIKMIQNDSVVRQRQDEIDMVGLYCGKRVEGDEILDWNQNSRDIFNFVRAICIPGPQARSFIQGKEIRINKVRMVSGSHEYKGIPGQLLGKSKKGCWYIKTKDTMVEILEYKSDIKLRTGMRLIGKHEIHGN